MTAASVLVPYRPDGGYRDRAWQWVHRWWATAYPRWQVVEGRPPPGPWCKALAVRDALARADHDLLVIADADVVCDGVGEAVAAVVGGAAWAVPHERVHRLTEHATRLVLAGTPPDRIRGGRARTPYVGVAGGGMVVIPRGSYVRAPLDPRFRGWGQEDESAGLAWHTLLGRPWRGTAALYHLWHPPAPRLNAHVGSRESRALHVRYQYAANTAPAQAARAAMARLIAEHRQTTTTAGGV